MTHKVLWIKTLETYNPYFTNSKKDDKKIINQVFDLVRYKDVSSVYHLGRPCLFLSLTSVPEGRYWVSTDIFGSPYVKFYVGKERSIKFI